MKHVLAWSAIGMIDETFTYASEIKPKGLTSIKLAVSTCSHNVPLFSIFPDDGCGLFLKKGIEEPTIT